MTKANTFVLKESSEGKEESRLQEVFKTSLSRQIFAGNLTGLFKFNKALSPLLLCKIN